MSTSDQAIHDAIQGRWDLTLQTSRGERPSWVEIHHSGRALVGQFVGITGSARPIGRIDVGNGKFTFSIPEHGDGKLVVEGQVAGEQLSGTIVFPDGTSCTWSGKKAPALRHTVANWGAPITLFTGTDLSGWHTVQGENHWEAKDGVLVNTKTGGNLVTDQKFSDFKLHIEFCYPPKGNSGVYLRSRYEVQIVDWVPEPTNTNIGGVYGFLAPSEIAAFGPNDWQTYDITLVGRMVTIVLNGKTVISNQEIPGITGGALDSDEGAPGPILLQGDHGPIQYRNIVLTPAAG